MEQCGAAIGFRLLQTMRFYWQAVIQRERDTGSTGLKVRRLPDPVNQTAADVR